MQPILSNSTLHFDVINTGLKTKKSKRLAKIDTKFHLCGSSARLGSGNLAHQFSDVVNARENAGEEKESPPATGVSARCVRARFDLGTRN